MNDSDNKFILRPFDASCIIFKLGMRIIRVLRPSHDSLVLTTKSAQHVSIGSISVFSGLVLWLGQYNIQYVLTAASLIKFLESQMRRLFGGGVMYE
jgi:hypothetical protein